MKIPVEMVDELNPLIPPDAIELLQGRYLEYPSGNKETEGVIEVHCIGNACHFDFRVGVNDHLIGMAIVGFSKDENPNIGSFEINKGYRAETKASQPKGWLFKGRKIGEKFEFKPGEVGAGVDAPGTMEVVDRMKVKFGTLKPYFLEYFIKSEKRFKEWTRIIFTAIRARRLEPEKKEPTGKVERMWRFMIPKTQTPYAISRGITKGWKPPKGIVPFPEDFVKNEYPEKYEKWKKYMAGELSEELKKSIRYAFVSVSWMGPRAKTGRQLPQYRFYLLLEDKKGSLRVFLVDGNMMRDDYLSAFEYDRVGSSWLDREGMISPDTPFNPNKELAAKYSPLSKGKVTYGFDHTAGKPDVISIRASGIRGSWVLSQTERGSDHWTLRKISKEEKSMEQFVLHKHCLESGCHWDIRFKSGWEINIYEDPLQKEPSSRAIRKGCPGIEKWWFTEGKRKIPVGGVMTDVEYIDHGSVNVLNNTASFSSFIFHGKKLKGYFILKKSGATWIFQRSAMPGEKKLSGLEPLEVPKVVDIAGRETFTVYFYDIKKFSRCETEEKSKKYFDFNIPEGIRIGVCLYPVSGEIPDARIGYIIAERKKWNLTEITDFFNRHKLRTWKGKQIREKKEELAEGIPAEQDDELIVSWFEISNVDVTGRTISGSLLTPEGKREATFGVMSDPMLIKILPLYQRGKRTLLVRVWKGFIIDLVDYLGSDEDG